MPVKVCSSAHMHVLPTSWPECYIALRPGLVSAGFTGGNASQL